MNLFKELVKKYGVGMIIGAATLDGYRRQILNDKTNNLLDAITKEAASLEEDKKLEYLKQIEEMRNKTVYKAALGRWMEAADKHNKAMDNYNADPTDYNTQEVKRLNKEAVDCIDEVRKLDISEYFITLYNKYGEYLDSLTPDKIVCLFNIIVGGLTLSSFLSILTILLSENIINKIVFLEKYPRILKLLKLRNNLNKKVSKIYLLMHIILIICGILGNIYMFFI